MSNDSEAGLEIRLYPKSPNPVTVYKKDGTEIELEAGDCIVVEPYFSTPTSVVQVLRGTSVYCKPGSADQQLEEFSLTVSGSTGRTAKSASTGSAEPRFAQSLADGSVVVDDPVSTISEEALDE